MPEEGGGGDGPGVKNENGELFDGSDFLRPWFFVASVPAFLHRDLGSCEVCWVAALCCDGLYYVGAPLLSGSVTVLWCFLAPSTILHCHVTR